jgi:hypothetical protein
MREFNVTGVCVPKLHYMVDTTPQINQIIELVNQGKYFTINRSRQFGKTTTLFLLRNKLSDRYLVAQTSFEGIDTNTFHDQALFTATFIRRLQRSLKTDESAVSSLVALADQLNPQNIEELGEFISSFCAASEKAVVLMIDEVDKTADNQIFLDFLGMLRDKYLLRQQGDDEPTFQSVILAGVHDIKNMKNKIRSRALEPTGEKSYNSPWNIATDFEVDMSFGPDEISTMLAEYEKDWHTGMDIRGVSEAIYGYTSGYPFLVSKICKLIDERLGKNWTPAGVQSAVKVMLLESNTLFDDLFKNIENDLKLYALVSDLVIGGQERSFAIGHPEMELGVMYGILAVRGGLLAVSNEIFELLIANYLSAKLLDRPGTAADVTRGDVVKGGRFDMELCLRKFAHHCHEIYDKKDAAFLEREGRLLFLTFLKPLINGQGFYHIEPQTRNAKRMDVVVDFASEQFIIELKRWYGDKDHQEAYEQLAGYLDAKCRGKGYLLTFDFRKVKGAVEPGWVEYHGKQIFDIIV